MLTNRDIEIIEFIKEFKLLSSSQIQRLFNMTQPKTSKRMNYIVENIKEVKKYRYNPTNNFYTDKYRNILKNENIYYYNKKPSAIMHDLLTNEVYLYLKERFDIVTFEKEYRISMDDEFVVRADVYFVMQHENKEYEFLIEVENNKSFNSYKYNKLLDQGYIAPPIIVISDRRAYGTKGLDIIKTRLNMSDLENKIKKYIIESEFGYKIN